MVDNHEHGSASSWSGRILWLIVGAIISTAVYFSVHEALDAYHRMAGRPIVGGAWVAPDGKVGLVAEGDQWHLHVNTDGYILKPMTITTGSGESTGDLYCAMGGQRIGRFIVMLGDNPNTLRVELRREGVVADPSMILKRPS